MAGLSSRFLNEGYKLPKFMLKLNGNTLFYHSIKSFSNYIEDETFIFITLKRYGCVDFIENELKLVGVVNYKIVELENDTLGQASTIFEGLQEIQELKNEDPLIIFNIDTFRPNYLKPDFINSVDGYLEVFEGEGDNWSFCKVSDTDSSLVVKTAEKEPISNYCSTGLYYFARYDFFKDAFQHSTSNVRLVKGEYYVAPLYNFLIGKGLKVRIAIIEEKDVVFCGTPDEYEKLRND